MKRDDELRRRRVLLFGQPLDERGLEVLERRFECGKPCFMRVGVNGGFDPLDAMRRDAYREVCMWLRSELDAFRKEQNHE